jgi:hypothetical protein
MKRFELCVAIASVVLAGCGGDNDGPPDADPRRAPDGSDVVSSGGVDSSGPGGVDARVPEADGVVYREGGAGPGAWADISPPSSGGRCSGVAVNSLTGEVFADANTGGIWRSTDRGGTWARVDGGAVSGLAVEGPGFDVDQNDPRRMAVWSLDGTAAWTHDGATWTSMASIGRNWDFGATDWSVPSPTTMFGVRHESMGEVYVSTNAGRSWNRLAVTVLASGGGWPPPAFAMVGVMNATTLVYGNGDGIYRSTDTGATFRRVSDLNVKTRVPVLFRGTFYLGGDRGLVVSRDQGATWSVQGAALSMWVGPFFGADERNMVAANSEGVFWTADAGTTWTRIAALPPDPAYDPRVWGGIAWDPNGRVLYAASTDHRLLKLNLPLP